MICDFCSSTEVNWAYPAADVVIGDFAGLRHISAGAWAACDACQELIEAGDRQALFVRSVVTWKAMYERSGLRSDVIDAMIRTTHEAFWRAKLDEPPKFVPGGE